MAERAAGYVLAVVSDQHALPNTNEDALICAELARLGWERIFASSGSKGERSLRRVALAG